MTKDLIERLEAATGADRELDALIWCYFHGVRYADHNEAYTDRRLTQVHYTTPPKRKAVVTHDSGPFPHAQPYTASLDASLALVGEKLPGWAWSVGNKLYGGQAYLMRAPGGEMISGAGASPALAVLLALFRALETK